ncbi:MAG: prepilin-type N-terminal cleavage/methylation domain-containing protein [Bacillota bacterium]
MQFIWKRMKKNQKGFTLVELLVVVVILGILATLAMQSIGDRSDDARKAKADADLRTLLSAIELYRVDTGAYPATLSGLTSALVPNYLKTLPNVTTYTVTSGEIDEIVVTEGSGGAAKTATFNP